MNDPGIDILLIGYLDGVPNSIFTTVRGSTPFGELSKLKRIIYANNHKFTNGIGKILVNNNLHAYIQPATPYFVDGLTGERFSNEKIIKIINEYKIPGNVECLKPTYSSLTICETKADRCIEQDGEYFTFVADFYSKYIVCQCGRIESSADSYRGPGDSHICEVCSENTFECENCGGTFWTDDYAGDGMCYDCYHSNEDEDNDGPIHDYSWKPTPTLHSKSPKDKQLYFGIELELECGRGDSREIAEDFVSCNDIKFEDLYLKYDGSIDNGFEIVSHPRTLESWHDFDLASKLEWLIGKRCKSHNTTTCGIHVHFSKKYLSLSHQLKLGMFFWNNFDKIQIFSRRKFNTYCRPKPDLKKKLLVSTSYDRYEAINWTDLKAPEIRIFRGSLKYSTVLSTIEFTHALIQFTKYQNTVDIATQKVNWDSFAEWIKKQNYKELPAYMNSRNFNTTAVVQNVSTEEM